MSTGMVKPAIINGHSPYSATSSLSRDSMGYGRYLDPTLYTCYDDGYYYDKSMNKIGKWFYEESADRGGIRIWGGWLNPSLFPRIENTIFVLNKKHNNIWKRLHEIVDRLFELSGTESYTLINPGRTKYIEFSKNYMASISYSSNSIDSLNGEYGNKRRKEFSRLPILPCAEEVFRLIQRSSDLIMRRAATYHVLQLGMIEYVSKQLPKCETLKGYDSLQQLFELKINNRKYYLTANKGYQRQFWDIKVLEELVSFTTVDINSINKIPYKQIGLFGEK